jgi:hypothetical protein
VSDRQRSYTAFRTAMDHPLAVTHLTVLDGVPIIEALDRCTARFAQACWHWLFFGQLEIAERAFSPTRMRGTTVRQTLWGKTTLPITAPLFAIRRPFHP